MKSMNNLKKYIESLVQEGCLWKFYKCREWMELKEKVLKKNHYECMECKKKGRITRADTVHHVRHVKDWPELALSERYMDDKGRQKKNLIPVCKACHNKLHPEKRKKNKKSCKFMNEERW